MISRNEIYRQVPLVSGLEVTVDGKFRLNGKPHMVKRDMEMEMRLCNLGIM